MLTKVTPEMLEDGGGGSDLSEGGTIDGDLIVTGQVNGESGLAVDGTLTAGAGIASTSAVFQWSHGTDAGISGYRSGAAGTTDECFIAFFAKDDTGTIRKTMSISESTRDTTENGRWGVLRLNANYSNAGVSTDYIGIRIFGGRGVTIDGLGESDSPYEYSTAYKFLIRGQTIHALPGTGSNTHFNFINGAAANGVGSTIGSIVSSGSSTSYNTSSDKTWKIDNGEFTFEQARAILDLIEFHNFTWNEKSSSEGETDHGAFAQDLYEIYPNAVTPGEGVFGEKGYRCWSVDYSKLMTVVARCVQGVLDRQDDFDARLAAIEGAS